MVKQIDPCPYQHRRYFDEDSLKQLARNIEQDGLIEPIIVRPAKKGRFELIAGQRRLLAIQSYTTMTLIQAKIVMVDDV